KIVAKNSCQARIIFDDQNASAHTSRYTRDYQRGCRADIGCAVQMKSSVVIVRNTAHDRETKPAAIPVSRTAPRKPLLHTMKVLGGTTFAVIHNRGLNTTTSSNTADTAQETE